MPYFKGPLWISMKNSPISKSLPNSSVYPKVNHFHKFEDLISLKNVKFEFLKVILSLKAMIDRTLFF